jgi:hypothetical protein
MWFEEPGPFQRDIRPAVDQGQEVLQLAGERFLMGRD